MNNEFKCKQCDKIYKSQSSRSNHIKRVHNVVVIQNVNTPVNIDVNTKVNCKFCKKSFTTRQSKSRHEKYYCKKEKENEDIKEKLENQGKQINILLETVDKLQNELIKNNKNITNNINNGNIIHNHIQINAIGSEDFMKQLSDKQQLDVLTAGLFDESPIVELVRKTYNDDTLKENRNTYIPNLQSDSCLTYNNEKKRFDAVNKNKHIDNIIKNRKDDIIKMYAKHGNKMKPAHKKIFNEYIENINNNESIKNKELYQKHKKEINYIIYNDKEFMKKVKDIVDKTEINIEDSEEENDDEEEQPVPNIVL